MLREEEQLLRMIKRSPKDAVQWLVRNDGHRVPRYNGYATTTRRSDCRSFASDAMDTCSSTDPANAAVSSHQAASKHGRKHGLEARWGLSSWSDHLLHVRYDDLASLDPRMRRVIVQNSLRPKISGPLRRQYPPEESSLGGGLRVRVEPCPPSAATEDHDEGKDEVPRESIPRSEWSI
jgi:hypothetical protein